MSEQVMTCLIAPDPPPLMIQDQAQRSLVTLRIVDGRLTAEYDPADLDEAARRFVESIIVQGRTLAAEVERLSGEVDRLRAALRDLPCLPSANGCHEAKALAATLTDKGCSHE